MAKSLSVIDILFKFHLFIVRIDVYIYYVCGQLLSQTCLVSLPNTDTATRNCQEQLPGKLKPSSVMYEQEEKEAEQQ